MNSLKANFFRIKMAPAFLLMALIALAVGCESNPEPAPSTSSPKPVPTMPDTGPVSIDFTQLATSQPAVLTSIKGLSGQESFGIWSKDKTVTFQFSKPLPKKFSLTLTATPYGPNDGKPVLVTVGDATLPLTFTGKSTEQKAIIENSNQSSILRIEIPQPTSPQDFSGGSSKDTRTLGLAFRYMEITPL